MLILLSPAKTLNTSLINYINEYSRPVFEDDAFKIINHLKTLKVSEISSLMNLSKKLSELNFSRYRSFKKEHTTDNAKQAIFTFNGEVYIGLNSLSYRHEDLIYSQSHLAILSGLYGYLRPLDLIQAYRLEMGTPIIINKAKSLYAFWSKKVTSVLNQETSKNGYEFIINLASKEYFKVIDQKKVKAKIINIDFKENKNGKLVTIGFNAKRARGLITSFILKNRIQKIEEIYNFSESGYFFDSKTSTASNLNFIN